MLSWSFLALSLSFLLVFSLLEWAQFGLFWPNSTCNPNTIRKVSKYYCLHLHSMYYVIIHRRALVTLTARKASLSFFQNIDLVMNQPYFIFKRFKQCLLQSFSCLEFSILFFAFIKIVVRTQFMSAFLLTVKHLFYSFTILNDLCFGAVAIWLLPFGHHF